MAKEHGRSIVQEATDQLIAIAGNTAPEFFYADIDDFSRPYVDIYDQGRLLKLVLGLQTVILKNGARLPLTWLPDLVKQAREDNNIRDKAEGEDQGKVIMINGYAG